MAERHMRFVGVTTGSSSIMTVFPRWSQALGLDAALVGVDLPLDAPAERYRAAVRDMRDDETCAGALVTTHKIALHDAAHDLFDELDEFARRTGEISSVALRPDGPGGGRTVHGAAKDPLTAGLALEEVLAADHFAAGGEVLCLGAGGAGTAICWYLTSRPDAPHRLTVVDVDAARLTHLREVVAAHAPEAELVTAGPHEVRALVEGLPPHSLVVNATGLGKDRPGSPVPAATTFPADAVVWELNYRGTLELLHHARSQESARRLRVVDGWRYFVHGWTQAVSEVFGVPMDAPTLEELSRLAEDVRGPG